MNLTSRFADRFDNGFELKNRGILVHLQQNGSLGRLGITQKLGQAPFQLGLWNRLTVQVGLVLYVDHHTGLVVFGLLEFLVGSRIPTKMAVVLSFGQDDEEDEQKKAMSPMAMEGTDASKLRLGIFIFQLTTCTCSSSSWRVTIPPAFSIKPVNLIHRS